ncbi:trypsin-like peptidase domain-containing protein [Aquincola sp. S2]|uniref:Serine protease n=1 Tax=Pseudaquabacterium terrae TaxID=2732868 RepID=A0ABX2EER4_9BURK|nr:serine protease [Aquabacterium terrae]NRF67108.1 trypsin-like peptidase domain-containing protein [Aquabacterium terrae]
MNRSVRNNLIGALLVLLLLALVFGWWLFNRVDPSATSAQRLLELRKQQEQLMAQLANVPSKEPRDCPPGQKLQLLPAGGAASSAVGAASEPAIAAASTPDPGPAPAGGEAAVLSAAALAQRLEMATAIVIVAGQNDLGSGTGFFITPNLLVTNRHVVEHVAGKRLFVTSRALGTLRRASVVTATSSSTIGAPDFALLKLHDGTASGTLELASEVSKLATVVAAGYPGVVLRNDANFRRLMSGDLSAAPDLNLTQGAVQSLQAGANGLPLVIHTAAISQGNSGGPLVDGCGRVVAVNTFINVDQQNSTKTHYAIRSAGLVGFLESAGASTKMNPRACGAKG